MNFRQMMGGAAALLLIATMVQPVTAQRPGRWATSWWYSTVVGVGDTNDFVSGFSFRGASLDVEKALTEDLTLGVSTGWHVLSDEDSGTFVFDGGAITGSSFRSMNSVPLLVTGNYYLSEPGGTRPFLGAGAGTYWIKNRTEAGVIRVEESNWHLGLMGEAGIVIRRPSRTFMLSARFNWALENNDIEATYLTFSVGLTTGG